MNDAARCIAYVVARYLAGPRDITIWDAQSRSYGQLTGTVDPWRIDVRDTHRSCHISGPGRDGAFSLYDFGDSSRLSLRIGADGRFDGHHDRTNTRFCGRIEQGSVDLYDCASRSHFNFQVRLRPRPADQVQATNGHRNPGLSGSTPVLPRRKPSPDREVSRPPGARVQRQA